MYLATVQDRDIATMTTSMSANASHTTLAKLIPALTSGELPLEKYIDSLQQRFEEIEPRIHAFLEEPDRFVRLRRDAQELAERFPDQNSRPPLFGVPLAIKDIFNVDGFETRAGTTLPPETFKGPEAPCVTALKNAGALVLGKSVTTEFAYLAPGPTRNPHDLEHTPGGSSSGSAASVAAGLAPLALGSQTVGSLIRPAAYCGICAFKPSHERIDIAGVLPLGPSADHVGLLASDIASLAMATPVIVNDWRGEPTVNQPVLGVPHENFLGQAENSARAHFGMACELLDVAGFDLRYTDALAGFEELFEQLLDLVAIEAAEIHADWRMQWEKKYDPRTLKLLDRARNVNDERRSEVHATRLELRLELEHLMQQNGIDVWISPAATSPAPLGLGSTGSGAMNAPWSHAGMPTTALPAGRSTEGLPMGIQVTGRFDEDEQTVAYSRLLEPLFARA